MRVRFVLKEVIQGLGRNLTMTLALVLTVAVSLGLFGVGMMVRAQVNTMKDFWYDKVQVSVFLCGETSPSSSCPDGPVTQVQKDQIAGQLDSMRPLVEEVYYESSQDAYDRFKEQYKNSPLLENITPSAMPESFRVKLSDPTQFATVATAIQGSAGVEQVRDQRRVLDQFFKILNGLQAMSLVVAIAMLVVSVLLVANTIRVAAYTRRRETGIMKLVGASNFYIQLPFLLEAAIAAAVGAALAVAGLAAIKAFLIDNVLAPQFRFTAFISWSDVGTILAIVVVAGTVLASIAAFITSRRYLKV